MTSMLQTAANIRGKNAPIRKSQTEILPLVSTKNTKILQ